jgi:hypothetical protein
VALWPGSVLAAIAYRAELREARASVPGLGAASVLGGLLGAWLLLHTPNAVFERVVPALLLVATLLVTFGQEVSAGFDTLRARLGSASFRRALVIVIQFAIATYGGYFGGGMGILMLATLTLFGMQHIHSMNAVKCLLAALINLVAISAFILAGKVAWVPALIMTASAALGGYVGGARARLLDPRTVKGFVLVSAWLITAYFFFRNYAR